MHPDRMFTSLHHMIDINWMREAYRRTRKDGAVGIDGVTAAAYGTALEANLEYLLSRIKSGRCRAVGSAALHPEGRPVGTPARYPYV